MWQKIGKSNILYLLALLTSAGIWGVATPVVKYTVSEIPPFTFLFLRFSLASIFCVPIAIYFIRKYKFNLTRIKKILLATLIGHIITLSLFFIGVSKTSAVEASIITAFSPLILSFLAFSILRETIRKNELEGILIAFIGVILIVVEPFITDDLQNDKIVKTAFVGNLIMILAVISDALYNLYLKKHIVTDKIINPINLVIFAYILGVFAYLPLATLEQINLYQSTKSLTTPQYQIRFCTAQDYDKAQYTNQIKCDQNGCYVSGVSDLPKITYECMAHNQDPQAKSATFINYVTNNLISYFGLWNILGVAYMAFISGLLAYMLFAVGLKKIEVSDAAPFLYTQPIFGITVAVLFLNEKPTVIVILALFLIIIGVIHSIKKKNRPKQV